MAGQTHNLNITLDAEIAALNTDIVTGFGEGLKGKVTDSLIKFAKTTQSKTESTRHLGLGPVKGWRKWSYESDRVSGSLATEQFLITNERFEDTLDLEIDAIKDQAHLDFPKKASEMAHAYLLYL